MGDEKEGANGAAGFSGGAFAGLYGRMGSEAWARVRHGRWRKELEANALNVPSAALVRLEDHT